MDQFKHSVLLDKDRCKGCINCIKRCPTRAIRVRDGKANIISELCIDCGECIRICPHKAKRAHCDSLEVLKDYEYTVALPAPSLYTQFNNLDSQDIVIDALLKIGFDDVFEVAYAAELVSEATRLYMSENKHINYPIISSACPAVTRLIRVRYPELIKNVLPLATPVDIAGRLARERAMKKTGLPPEKIGCIFLTPCPAKMTAIYQPIGFEQRTVDAAVAVNEVYPLLLKHMTEGAKPRYENPAGKFGVGWAEIGGESTALVSSYRYLAADGIENVIRVLEDLESHKYDYLEFVELSACAGGCVGGVLQVENPYIARAKLKRVRHLLPVTRASVDRELAGKLDWKQPLEYSPVMELGGDLDERMTRYSRAEQILSELPGLDCGSCGAPTCQTFAEDVVNGVSGFDDCVVIMRQKMEEVLRVLDPGTKEGE